MFSLWGNGPNSFDCHFLIDFRFFWCAHSLFVLSSLYWIQEYQNQNGFQARLEFWRSILWRYGMLLSLKGKKRVQLPLWRCLTMYESVFIFQFHRCCDVVEKTREIPAIYDEGRKQKKQQQHENENELKNRPDTLAMGISRSSSIDSAYFFFFPLCAISPSLCFLFSLSLPRCFLHVLGGFQFLRVSLCASRF